MTGVIDRLSDMVDEIGSNYQIKVGKAVFFHISFKTKTEIQPQTKFIWLGSGIVQPITNIAFPTTEGEIYTFGFDEEAVKTLEYIPSGKIFVMDFSFILS